MIRKGLLVSCLILVWGTHSLAQKVPDFSLDGKVFQTQLKAFFLQDNHPEIKPLMDQFEEMWVKNNLYSTSEQNKIINLAIYMQQKKMKLWPDYYSYIHLIISYKNSKITEDRLDQYIDVAEKIMDSKLKKNYQDFNVRIEGLFTGLSLYSTENKNWKVSNDVYDITFDKEPVITFSKTDLQVFTRGDTTSIFETGGSYYPLSYKFIGKNGTVYWSRVGFDREKAFAVLNNYKIDLRNSDYRADSVLFSFPKVFDKPIPGRLDDKAMTEFMGVKASYPRFQSYQNIFTIKNIFENIDYRGGFTLEGAQIEGTGSDTDRASISIKQSGRVVVRALSKSFLIAPDRISAEKAAVSIYLDGDSIFHSQLYFHYVEKNRTLTLSRDNIGLYASPFFDSYHQMEFSTGDLIWDIDSTNIRMKTIANPGGPSLFESADFYQEDKYRAQQGILDYNPLERLNRICKTENKRNFTEAELAVIFNNKTDYLTSLWFELARQGYIFYDVEAHKITIKNKLIHYEAAAKNKADYDIINFQSVISKLPNASLDIDSKELVIQGVQLLDLSDSQNTYFIPKDQSITVRKNRDMKFVGQVHSGRFDFYGSTMTLDYDKFKIDLNDLDSVKFKYPEFDKEGKIIRLRTIQNTIQKVYGYLYIDEPGNKSGKKLNPEFPIFDCTKFSYVYYDKPSIYKGVYNRDSFYFKIDPFIVKNLGKFTAEGLQFPGAFTSANILPVFRYPLTIQEDFSLGFIAQSPDGGWPLYINKGIGKGAFKLSNRGLREDGEADYLDAKMYSDNFIYFPDSMNSNTKKFEIPLIPDGKYPPIAGASLYNHWMPYQDSLYIIHKAFPLSVYMGKIDFSGDLVLTPVELVGIGKLTYQSLDLSSQKFSFLPKHIKTDEGNLKIKAISGSGYAVTSDKITADIDLTREYGSFHTNDDTAKVALPSNKFSTNLNNFNYDINAQEVTFAKNLNTDTSDAYFVSDNPDMKGLKFNSTKATFKMAQQNIKAEDVPHLDVADSKIFTPNRELHIEKEGTIGAIKGAEIFTDGDNRNHRIYNAFVNVFSGEKFTGYGDFDYVDKNEKTFLIHFSDLRVDEQKHTVGKADIKDTSNFFLVPGIRYIGPVNLLSIRKNLEFDGYIMPDHKIQGLHSEWTKIADTIDPKNVVLNLEHPIGKDGKEEYTGVFVSVAESKLYNVMLGKKLSPGDMQVFAAKGYLVYNETTGVYSVGPKSKVMPEDASDSTTQAGNVFRANPPLKKVFAEGSFSFGANLKFIQLSTGGNYTYNFNDSSNLFELGMIVDFPMQDDAYKIMMDTIQDVAPGLFDLDNAKPSIYNAFVSMIQNRKDNDRVMGDLTGSGVIPIVDETNKMFVISSVKMTYSDTARSFISHGEIGVANSRATIINKLFKGVVEVLKSNGGDRFSIILGDANGGYYFFSYRNGDITYQSSDDNFTAKVKETASKFLRAYHGLSYRLATVPDVQTLFNKSIQK